MPARQKCCFREHRLEKNSGTHDIGESIVWTPFLPPESGAEVAPQSRKQVVLGPLFLSNICIFKIDFWTTCIFEPEGWSDRNSVVERKFFDHSFCYVFVYFLERRRAYPYFCTAEIRRVLTRPPPAGREPNTNRTLGHSPYREKTMKSNDTRAETRNRFFLVGSVFKSK